MNLHEKIRSFILSRLVEPETRTIGMEEECFLYTKNNRRLPVNPCGEFSATDLLTIMNENVGTNGIYTLEPGGQLEWSSPPYRDLNDLFSALEKHKQTLNGAVNANDLRVISYGVEPNYAPDDIDLINKLKYQLMNVNMEQNGTMGKWMMRNTTSVQVNFDITSERDLEDMTFVADCLQPVCAYFFANSPFRNGQPTGTENIRNVIWENTDNTRCRNLIDHGIGSPDGLIDRYIDYIMTVPGIFELDENGIIVATSKTIGERLVDLERSDKLRTEDIQTALHQIFTNVRLKHLVEVRGADRPPMGFEMAPVAFWTSILTVGTVRDELLSVVKNWTLEERHDFNKASLILDDSQIGPEGKSYEKWNQWVGDLALAGLKERCLGEEKFFASFFEIVMEKGPFGLQAQ
jgi:glutamate--cysteine ligase